MPKEIKIMIGIWAIVSLALILTACVQDMNQEAETEVLERDCIYYDYQDDRSVGNFDSVLIMLRKGYRICE